MAFEFQSFKVSFPTCSLVSNLESHILYVSDRIASNKAMNLDYEIHSLVNRISQVQGQHSPQSFNCRLRRVQSVVLAEEKNNGLQ